MTEKRLNEKCRRYVCILLVLLMLFLPLVQAETYVDASGRINFYYQYDGGGKDQQGTWDKLLADRLYKLYGHSTIYEDSSTSRYLTGRGCCLFTYAHAYQYLLGYASSQSAKADILYKFISQKPVWSNTGSTASPPNAAGYYNSYFSGFSSVTRYTGALDTFSKLKSFFEGGRSCIVVNAPGHYILAVGCTTHDGVQYVQIVDSVLSGTIQSGRCTLAKSMNFSETYTPSNAVTYTPTVHQYWLPYSQFASKCKLSYAYRSSSAPNQVTFEVEKTTLTIPVGDTARIVLKNVSEAVTYQSANTSICKVDSNGKVTALKAGETYVTVKAKDNSSHSAVVTVRCFEVPEQTVKVQGPLDQFVLNASLPSGTTVVFDMLPEGYGIYNAVATIYDKYGDAVGMAERTFIIPDPEKTLFIPETVSVIESEAFAGVTQTYLYVPMTVKSIGDRAFADSSIIAVMLESSGTSVAFNAFEGCSGVVFAVKQ